MTPIFGVMAQSQRANSSCASPRRRAVRDQLDAPINRSNVNVVVEKKVGIQCSLLFDASVGIPLSEYIVASV